MTFTEYPTPTLNSTPNEIIKGPDGNVWFTEFTGNRLGNIDALGHITESATLANANSAPNGLNIGPDGAVWFTEDNVGVRDAVGRIATISGPITEWDGPSGIPSSSGPYDIITGLDSTTGNQTLWFTESGGQPSGGIMEITTAGVASQVWSGSASQYDQITKGPDGALWFTEWATGGKIYRIDSTKTVTPYPISATADPYDLVAGPDGNIWFTEYYGSKVGRMCVKGCAPVGTVTEFATAANSQPNGITVGSDGNLYVAEYGGNAIARVTTGGTVTEFPIPTTTLNNVAGGPGPVFITTGSDGNLWATEYNANNILKVVPSLLGTTTPGPTPSPTPCESDKDDQHQKPGHDNQDHAVIKPWKDCRTKTKKPHH